MILCPHCERPLGAEHDDPGCRRRQSRRYFLGALAGLAVGAAVAPLLGKPSNIQFEGFLIRMQGQEEPFLEVTMSTMLGRISVGDTVDMTNFAFEVPAERVAIDGQWRVSRVDGSQITLRSAPPFSFLRY